MIKKIVCIAVCFGVLLSCKKETANPKSELSDIIEKLKSDENHQFLKTLRPSEADIFKIFTDKMIADKVLVYSDSKWNTIDNVPHNTMKPGGKDNVCELVPLCQSNSEKAEWGKTNISTNYLMLCGYIKKGIAFYALEYVDSEGESIKSRAAFFRVDGKWVFIPQVYKAFV